MTLHLDTNLISSAHCKFRVLELKVHQRGFSCSNTQPRLACKPHGQGHGLTLRTVNKQYISAWLKKIRQFLPAPTDDHAKAEIPPHPVEKEICIGIHFTDIREWMARDFGLCPLQCSQESRYNTTLLR